MDSRQSAYAYNETRQAFLATELRVADTHWTRLKGLIGSSAREFSPGMGLWIVPCHGVHTLAMSFPIDVIYLDEAGVIVHLVQHLRPWRFAAVRLESVTVVELPSETISRTGTQVGDRVEIQSKAAAAESQLHRFPGIAG